MPPVLRRQTPAYSRHCERHATRLVACLVWLLSLPWPWAVCRLVEEHPDRAVSWFAVGCYYMCSQQYEQVHIPRPSPAASSTGPVLCADCGAGALKVPAGGP